MTNLRYRRIWIYFVMILMMFTFCKAAEAISVFPGAVGFGTETSAGRGGQVLKVTNLNASGPGSLKAAVDASGPRVVVFEVSGTIRIDGDLRVRNPYITIAGQTAPSPGVTLRGATVIIMTHDVLIQHIRVRVGDQGGADPDVRDGIVASTSSGAYNVVIDHCSISWAIDENTSAGHHNVTFSNCIIAEGLRYSLHSKVIHSMGMNIGVGAYNVAIISNLIAHNMNRNPYLRRGTSVLVNNLIYNTVDFNINMEPIYGTAKYAIVANHAKRGPSSGSNTKDHILSIRGNFYKNGVGSSIYLSENKTHNYEQTGTSNWDNIVDNRFLYNTANFKVNSAYLWPTGLVALDKDDVEASVIANAGARPADRDAVDKRIVNDVKNGTGRLIDSQYDVGGWPDLARNTRNIETMANPIPASPHRDDDGDGYTNLEEWLHTLAAIVEGKEQATLSSPKNVHIETSN